MRKKIPQTVVVFLLSAFFTQLTYATEDPQDAFRSTYYLKYYDHSSNSLKTYVSDFVNNITSNRTTGLELKGSPYSKTIIGAGVSIDTTGSPNSAIKSDVDLGTGRKIRNIDIYGSLSSSSETIRIMPSSSMIQISLYEGGSVTSTAGGNTISLTPLYGHLSSRLMNTPTLIALSKNSSAINNGEVYNYFREIAGINGGYDNSSYVISTVNYTPIISNSGLISGPNGIFLSVQSGSTATTYEDVQQYVSTIYNAGIITSRVSEANSEYGYAINIDGPASSNITNVESGIINGNIRGDLGKITLENSGIINGNVNLGTNSTSTMTIESGGSNSGKATFGNSAQVLNIREGATFNGSIAGTLSAVNLAGALNFTENGSFTGNIIGSGTGNLNLGATNQTLNGNLTLVDGDTLRVGFIDDAMSESAKISVLGSANIDSDIKIVIDARSGYNLVANGTRYHLVSGNSSSNVNAVSDQNISFSDSSPSGVFSILKFTSEAVNNSDLYLIANVLSAAEVTTNTNSQNVYDYIGSIGNSATGNLALFGQYLTKATSRQEVESALKSATPQADDGIRQNNLNNVNSSFASIENRLDQFGRYQIKEPITTTSYRLKSGDEAVEKKEGEVSGQLDKEKTISDKKFGSWAQVITESSRQGAIQDTAGYDNNRNGLAFGFDKITESGSVLGLAFNLSNSNIKSRDNLKITGVETYQISAYSRHLFSNDYFFDAMTSFAFNRYNSNRFIYPVSTNANAKFNGQVYSARIRSGFTKDLGSNFELTPDVSLTYAGGGNNSYNEEGAGTLNLKVSANNFDFLESRAGLKLGYKTKTTNGLVLIPQLKVSYGYDLIGDRQSVVSNFEGQSSSFTTQYAKYDKSSLRVGFGINLYDLNSFKLSSEYSFEDKTQYKSHSGFVRGEVRF